MLQLVPVAVQRQLWLLMLDRGDVQMPVMIPIGDLPVVAGAADGEGLTELLGSLRTEFDADSFVFVLERPATTVPSIDDARWMHHLLQLGDTSPFTIRAVYLAHASGITSFDVDALDALDAGPRG